MADKVLFVTPGDDGSYIPDQMIDDLASAAELSDEAIQTIVMAIESCEGVLNFEGLHQLVETVVGEERALPVAHVLMNLEAGDVQEMVDVLDAWREQSEENQTRISNELLQKLKERLPLLIRPFKAIELFRKARELAGVTGQIVKRATLLCDLRPVFGEDGERVECMLPLVTM